MIAKSEIQTTYPKIQNQRCSTPHEHCWWNHFQSPILAGKSTGIVLAQGFHPSHYSKRRGSPPSRRLSKWIGRSEIKKKIWGKKRVKFQTQFSNSLSSWMLKMCWKPTGLKIHLPMVSLYRQGSWNAPSKVGSHMPQSSRCMVYLVGGLEHGFYFSMYWE